MVNCLLTGDLNVFTDEGFSINADHLYTDTGTGIFQGVNAGYYYLPTNSTYHGSGSTAYSSEVAPLLPLSRRPTRPCG